MVARNARLRRQHFTTSLNTTKTPKPPPRDGKSGGTRAQSAELGMEPGELEDGEAPPEAGASGGGLELVFNGEALRFAVSRAGTGEASAAFRGERLDISSFWNPGAAVASALATLLLGSDRSDVWIVESDASNPHPSAQRLHADCVGAGKTVRRAPCSSVQPCNIASAIDMPIFAMPHCVNQCSECVDVAKAWRGDGTRPSMPGTSSFRT